MIRKTLTLITLILATLGSLTAYATEWYRYPVYCYNIDNVIETSSKVYYLSNGNLFSYSPSDNESFAYTQLNMLNDADITSVYYNNLKKYLLVVYKNSNLDVITDDGRVINMPDIKDASLSTTKNINDVAFGKDRIAIATDFGIVIYNDNRFEVVESGIYDQPINCIGIMGDNLLIYAHKATAFTIMTSPLNVRHNSLEKFKPLLNFGTRRFRAITDDIMVIRENNSNKLFLRKVNFENNTTVNIPLESDYAFDSDILAYRDGYYTRSANKIITFDGDKLVTYDVPESLHNDKFAFYDSPTVLWSGNADGICQMDISGQTPTLLHDRLLFDNYTTDKRVGYMRWSADGQRLYISNNESSINRSFVGGEGSKNYQTTNYVENGGWIEDVSLMNASAVHYYSTKYQKELNSTRMFGDPNWIVEDPDDTDKYYCGAYMEGLYVIKRNPETGIYEEIGKFTHENSPIPEEWAPRVIYVDIDHEGNLWLGHQFGTLISILPADKRRSDPSTITEADWKTYTQLEDTKFRQKDMTMAICKHSNMVFFAVAAWDGGFMAIDTKGTLADPSDDTIHHWETVTDQDGNLLKFNYITYIVEDQRGCVWVGTNAGVFEITNPSTATDNNMRVRRIKVPRNDGTNYADYLLESDFINWIGLDPAGRKWIATESSGLFLVSETGDKILKSFDMQNSPLTSNSITCVECDRTDNTVYIGTSEGLYSLKSDASPGHEDYSGIYAYPNPVRPDYFGMVTITGLMDKSVVKITDTAGNVVHQTQSEGGMAVWDACGPSGERVRSGVYYVYASQYDGSASIGAVTKILVIN